MRLKELVAKRTGSHVPCDHFSIGLLMDRTFIGAPLPQTGVSPQLLWTRLRSIGAGRMDSKSKLFVIFCLKGARTPTTMRRNLLTCALQQMPSAFEVNEHR